MDWIKKYGLWGGIGLLLIVAIIGFSIFHKNDKKLNDEDIALVEEIEETKPEVLAEVKEKEYYVDVKGSVKNPGVYKVKEGTIINDVITLAGGLKSGASTKNINLSKKISDEMVIYIYTAKELTNLNKESECLCDKVDISSCEGASVIISDNVSTSSNETKGLVNLNTASKEELMTLSGIGESKALAIIDYREKNGGFKTKEELMNVSGIGEASYKKIESNITV